MTEFALPLVNGIVLGDGEHYGVLDKDGNFVESPPFGGYRVPLQHLRDDMAIPVGASAEILDAKGNAIADLHVGAVDGRVACTKIVARPGQALSSETLRSIPIFNLVVKAAQHHIVFIRENFAVKFPANGLAFAPDGEVIGARRRTLDAEFLKRVARIYRTALATGKPPAVAVEETLGPTTPENARRWIALARKEGFLGAAPGAGKKGEVTPHNHQAEH